MRALNKVASILLLQAIALGADLPNAPDVQKKDRQPVGQVCASSLDFAPVAPAKKPWQLRHKKLVIVTGIALGAGAGVGIALATRRGACPSIINGYPYNGTPPCPGPNYDPGNRKR